MTCREKYFADHPEIDPRSFAADEELCGCPSDYGYVDETGDLCCCMDDDEVSCDICWDQEISGTEKNPWIRDRFLRVN